MSSMAGDILEVGVFMAIGYFGLGPRFWLGIF